jgi:hypothetical protein
MSVRLCLGRMAVAALLGAAGLASASAPAGADSCVTYQATSSSGGWVAAEKSARRGACLKPEEGTALVLPSNTASATPILSCLYRPTEPHLEGNTVVATIVITCNGDTPRQLSVYLDLGRYVVNLDDLVLDATSDCVSTNSPGLTCVAQATCFQAGATYDSYAVLEAIDEFNQVYQAQHYALPRYIACAT